MARSRWLCWVAIASVDGCFSEPGVDEGDGTTTNATAETTGPSGSTSVGTSVVTTDPDTSAGATASSGTTATGTDATDSTTGEIDACPPATPEPTPFECSNGVAESGELCLGPLTKLSDLRGAGYDLELADFTGDGIVDVVSANGFGDELVNPGVLLVGDGLGDFSTSMELPGSWHAWSFGAADLDGDSDIDLVAGASDGEGLIPLLNDGGGDFVAGEALVAPIEPTVVVSDLDDDGNVDAFAGGPESRFIEVYLGDGLGAMTLELPRRIELPDASGVRALDVGELDGDEYPDLVIVTTAGGTWVAYGVETGAAIPAPLIALGNSGLARVAAQLADLDGDGDLDLAVAAVEAVEIHHNESGTLSLASTLQMPGAAIVEVAVADLDRDTFVDLAIANGGNHTVRVVRGVGDGSFDRSNDEEIAIGANSGVRVIVTGLLDDDCVPDVLTANLLDESLSLLPSSP